MDGAADGAGGALAFKGHAASCVRPMEMEGRSGPNGLDTDTCIRYRVRDDETDVGSRYGCCIVTTGTCVSRDAVVEQDGSCYGNCDG